MRIELLLGISAILPKNERPTAMERPGARFWKLGTLVSAGNLGVWISAYGSRRVAGTPSPKVGSRQRCIVWSLRAVVLVSGSTPFPIGEIHTPRLPALTRV